jgi:cell division protein FtsL
MNRVPPVHLNSPIRYERNQKASLRMLVLLTCGLILTAGFILTVQMHFSTVRYGYLSEELKRERAQLIEEQQRLLLAREQITSPARLEKMGRSLGLKPVSSEQVGRVKSEDRATVQTVPAFIGPSAALAR